MSGLPDLAGKVAVVTGGASGIGKGIATRLAAEGARVIIADIQRDAMEATAAEIGALGVLTDVSEPAASPTWPAPPSRRSAPCTSSATTRASGRSPRSPT